MRLVPYIGWAEVNSGENEDAKRVSKLLKYTSILVIILLVVTWYLEKRQSFAIAAIADPQAAKELLSAEWFRLNNFVIWFFYFFRVAWLTVRVNDRRKFLVENWMNIFIVILGIPVLIFWSEINALILGMKLHFLLLGAILLPWIETCIESLSDGKLSTTLLTAFGIVILAGVLMAGFDENVTSIEDGIWWAWVTVTTVGYGDIVPLSSTGKVFGALLILMGLGLFSAITANFVTLFAKQDLLNRLEKGEVCEQEELAELGLILDKLERVEKYEQRLTESLKRINRRLDELERN